MLYSRYPKNVEISVNWRFLISNNIFFVMIFIINKKLTNHRAYNLVELQQAMYRRPSMNESKHMSKKIY